MALNLLDSVRGLLSGDLISRASNTLNEDETRVQNAMSGIVPSVLAGILNKAGSGNAGSILSMAKDTANSGMLSGIGNFLGNNSLLDRGSDLLRGIFGNRLNEVINMIASFAGIRSASAGSLMSVAAPAALGTLGAHAISTNMNERTLVSYLDSQKVSYINGLSKSLPNRIQSAPLKRWLCNKYKVRSTHCFTRTRYYANANVDQNQNLI